MTENSITESRCAWAVTDPLMVAYHDTEWGVPVHDDTMLFEMLTLEGMQAGLSWQMVLKRRETFRSAFENFDVTKIAAYTEPDVARLMADPGIIRHEGKVRAAISNARAFLEVQASFGSFDRYLWEFVDGKPIQNAWDSFAQVPAQTALSQTISKDLRKRGFGFVGPTISYAFMQAVGLVNDHTVNCFRFAALSSQEPT